MFEKNSVFESERLLFRGIRAEDAENLVRWRSREDVYRYSNVPEPITLPEHLLWFEKYLTRSQEIRAIIAYKAKNKDIGMVGGVIEDGVFVISYYIGEPEYRGKGLAGEAIGALIEFVLSQTEITAVHAYVLKDNAASISCLSKIGFKLLRRGEATDLYECIQRKGI